MFTAHHVVIMLKILPMRDRSCSGVNLWKCLKTGKNSSTTVSRSCNLLFSLFVSFIVPWEMQQMKKRFAHVHQSFDLMKLVINFCTSAQGRFEKKKAWTVLLQNNDLANCWLSYILKVQAISIHYTLKRNKLDLLIRFCIVGHRTL